MSFRELEELKDAYETVFDENGNVKACGRAVCLRLMYVIRKYSTADLGNFDTGVMNIKTIKAEYRRIVG